MWSSHFSPKSFQRKSQPGPLVPAHLWSQLVGALMLPESLFASLLGLISSSPTWRPLPLHRETSISFSFWWTNPTSVPWILPPLASPVDFLLHFVVSLLSVTLCLCWLFNISMCENICGPGGHRAKGSKPDSKTNTAWPHLHLREKVTLTVAGSRMVVRVGERKCGSEGANFQLEAAAAVET